MEKVPKFKTAKEEAEFWETHSPLDFPGEFEEVGEPIVERRGRKKGIYIRVDPGAIALARSIGARLGIGYQTLFRMWIMEGLGRHLTPAAGDEASRGRSLETSSRPPAELRRTLTSRETMVREARPGYGRRSPDRSTARRPAGRGRKHGGRASGGR